MNEFDKNMQTSQLAGGGVEVTTLVVIDGKVQKLFRAYQLNVPDAVKQFNKEFAEYRTDSQRRTDYAKEVKLQTAYEIIGRLDDGIQSVWIDKAIEKLQQLKHVRENIPF